MARALIALGAATVLSSAAIAQPVDGPPPAPKPEQRAAVERAERLGAAIYTKDQLAWRATDALLEEVDITGDPRLRGWITVFNQSDWLVRFVGEIDGDLFALYDVPFSQWEPQSVKELDPAQPLVGEELRAFNARQTAIEAMPYQCTAKYNSVVLQQDKPEDGWAVYLLAASTTEGEILAGGHFRIEVSVSGEDVQRVEPLSKSCLKINPQQEVGTEAEIVLVSHIISDTPIETHVFLSLLHRKPIGVVTQAGQWMVYGGRIGFVGELPDDPPDPDACRELLSDASDEIADDEETECSVAPDSPQKPD